MNCPERVTFALTRTWIRPSGGIAWAGIGATRSPDVLDSTIRTFIVTGSPLATVSRSGASLVPSE